MEILAWRQRYKNENKSKAAQDDEQAPARFKGPITSIIDAGSGADATTAH